MRLLVFEFITGGGYRNRPLPPPLAQEGELMLRQLLNDLTDCDEADSIVVLRDPRLPAVPGERVTTAFTHEDFWQQLAAHCADADLVLPIAPETDDVLLQVSEFIEVQGAVLLGSRPDAIRLTASKYQTSVVLAEQGIAAVTTYPAPAAPTRRQGEWVIKPDIGAGGEGCRLVNGKDVDFEANQILQPLIAGQAASLTMLCHQDRADLYACNMQYAVLDEHGYRFQGIGVNALAAQIPLLENLASDIASAIPGLWGWAGVDFILGDEGAVVLEINPRLTTSYVGLRESLQCNPAALLLQLQRDDCLPRMMGERRPVEVRL